MVDRLRLGEAFVPELSLVALLDGKVVGYLLLTKSQIQQGNATHETLTLAPLAVVPARQRMGVGSRLVEEGLRKATDLGFDSVHVLGHPAYYARWGFEQADEWGIFCPFEVPLPAFRVRELAAGALREVTGTVQYAAAFNEL